MLKLRQEVRSVKASNHALEDRLQELNRDVEEKENTIKELQELRLEDGENKQAPKRNAESFLKADDFVQMEEFT